MWGCLAKVAVSSHKHSNICPKTFDVVFIGYAQNSVAYKFMSLFEFSVSEYRDVEFFEHVFPLKRDVRHVVSESMNLAASSSSIRELVVEPRRSKRQTTETSFDPSFITSFW